MSRLIRFLGMLIHSLMRYSEARQPPSPSHLYRRDSQNEVGAKNPLSPPSGVAANRRPTIRGLESQSSATKASKKMNGPFSFPMFFSTHSRLRRIRHRRLTFTHDKVLMGRSGNWLIDPG